VADYWVSVSENIVAAVIWSVLVAATVFFVYWFRRRRVLKFFGLQNHARVVIYASRLWVPAYTSLGPDGQERSFEGIASPGYEAKLIAKMYIFFDGWAPLPKWAGSLSWENIAVEPVVSPPPGEIEQHATLIAIGSPGYNIVSEAIESDLAPPVRFARNEAGYDNSALELPRGSVLDDPFNGAVQRLVNTSTGQVAFYVGGPSAAGTTAATNYLLREWKTLAKRPLDRPFYVIVNARVEGEQYDVVAASP
jgi:hypothetical protein